MTLVYGDAFQGRELILFSGISDPVPKIGKRDRELWRLEIRASGPLMVRDDNVDQGGRAKSFQNGCPTLSLCCDFDRAR